MQKETDMDDLDDFIKEHGHEPKRVNRSVLEPYRDELLKMRKMGFTEKVMLQFLKEKKNLAISQQALNRFIRSRLNKQEADKKEAEKPVPAIKQAVRENQPANPAHTVKQEANKKDVEKTAPAPKPQKKKFQWPPKDVSSENLY
ncbi:hypothetical protein NEIMUCOT_03744 [Neisseria mucosa ATCC 25996]|uniref:Uncharacterized protein n=2 Tax=Neisseria mucosa TaxID=488 RepID=D2ZT11_NEIM2|nr:hypothetical protein NEIMUCOT_03744 [Neisseria mucosa ATCC 25996]